MVLVGSNQAPTAFRQRWMVRLQSRSGSPVRRSKSAPRFQPNPRSHISHPWYLGLTHHIQVRALHHMENPTQLGRLQDAEQSTAHRFTSHATRSLWAFVLRGIVARFASTKQDVQRTAGRSITPLRMASAGSQVAPQHHHDRATGRHHVAVASLRVGELPVVYNLVCHQIRHSQ